MDNITHSIIGLAAGEAVSEIRKQNQVPIWIASLLGNNFPDIDVPVDALLMNDPLDRLLHHRGFTHTLLLAPLQGLIVFLLVWIWYRRRPNFPWRETLLVSLLGPFLHLWADSWNSYGVHPFWPFSNRWYYGDYVFIVEPWIWVVFLPALFFAARTRPLRITFAAITAGILVVAWMTSLVPTIIAAILTAAAAGLFGFHWLLPSRFQRITSAWLAMAACLSLFALTSHMLESRFARDGFRLVISPYPGNPLCWTALESGIQGETYEARVLKLAPWPKLFPVDHCPRSNEGGTVAPLGGEPRISSDRSLLELGRFQAPRAELTRLSGNCRAEAFLRFARVPFWRPTAGGWVLADLRYDRGGGRNFAQVEIPGGRCPEFPAPWTGDYYPETESR